MKRNVGDAWRTTEPGRRSEQPCRRIRVWSHYRGRAVHICPDSTVVMRERPLGQRRLLMATRRTRALLGERVSIHSRCSARQICNGTCVENRQ
jgi:hypothetical protein